MGKHIFFKIRTSSNRYRILLWIILEAPKLKKKNLCYDEKEPFPLMLLP